MSDSKEGNVSKEESKINYPSNSHKAREKDAAPEAKIVEKVISGEAVQRKKPLRKRIAETFTGDDAQTVGNYVLFEVVIPAVKSLVVDAGKEALDRAFFGGASSSSRRISGGGRKNHVSYQTMYGTAQTAGRGDNRSLSNKARANHEFDEVVVPDRGQAEEVLERLIDLVAEYDVATVSDLYDLVGVTGSFTDDKWGWSDLRGSSVQRVRDGYVLNLPRPKAID